MSAEVPKARDMEAARIVALQGSQGLSGVAAHGNVSPRQAVATALAVSFAGDWTLVSKKNCWAGGSVGQPCNTPEQKAASRGALLHDPIYEKFLRGQRGENHAFGGLFPSAGPPSSAVSGELTCRPCAVQHSECSRGGTECFVLFYFCSLTWKQLAVASSHRVGPQQLSSLSG